MKTNLPHINEDLTFFVTGDRQSEVETEGEEYVMFVNTSQIDDEVVLITEEIKCLAAAVTQEDCVLIDCACPTTVAGEKWIMSFIERLSTEDFCVSN